jgi:FkbM family methyltransferase
MLISILRNLLRRSLETRGYYLHQRHALPYGLDYMLDIERLAKAWGWHINTFFDVGANAGDTSEKALSYFPSAKVIAFEPTERTFRVLKERLVKFPNFSAHRLALAETCGNVTFHEYSGGIDESYYNSLVENPPPRAHQVRTISVPCTTVDAFCTEHHIDGIDVLKIDAERCDLRVLRGAEHLLKNGRIRFVYCEFNNAASSSEETTLLSLADYVTIFEFRFVATYVERLETAPKFDVMANVLFTCPPSI